MALPLVILIPSSLVLLVWLIRHVLLTHSLTTFDVLRSGEPAGLPASPPKLSVIVPARDEEANIAACLGTLTAQDYPDFEIVVVDDRSSDRTAEVVRRAAESDPRIRLVQVSDLPAGWFGKSHAMHVGAQAAGGQWLLFVDADCRQSPGSLSTAMSYTLIHGGDMLSLWPMLEMQSLAENLVQPLCGSILALWFRPELVNDPRRKTAFANGQFVLVRRETYDAVGGHEAVRDRLVEDIAFARVVKGRGFRLLNAAGFDLFSTRMYDSLRGIWRGWTRIYSGAFLSAWSIALALLLVLVMSAAPFVLTAVAVPMAWRAGWSDGWLNALAAVGVAEIVAMMTVLVRYYRMTRARPAYLVLYPLTVVIVIGILVNALLARMGLSRVRWRGRTYAGPEKA